MAQQARRINITGKSGKVYDLDQIANTNTREDSDRPFVLHIKKYNPKSKDKALRSVIPDDVKIGSVWIARRDDNLGND